MSDGRHFTDYKTATRRNEYVKYINGLVRDDDYRLFLQKNAEQIMDNEWKFDNGRMQCQENECIHIYNTRTLPHYFVEERKAFDSIFDPKKPMLRKTCPVFDDYRMTTRGGSFYNGQTQDEKVEK